MKQDNQVYGIVKCQCGKKAMIMFSNNWVCGDCAVKLNNYNSNIVLNQLKEINKCHE